MIDIFFILFTGGMAVYVIVRAVILDKAEAWYEITVTETEVGPEVASPPCRGAAAPPAFQRNTQPSSLGP
jgi:hypothetical protein